MSKSRPTEYAADLVLEFCNLPHKTEWIEFKINAVRPQVIGEYISALANSAALVGKAFAYLVWGVSDENHEIVGTNFEPSSSKVGNEELENWLLRLLFPRIHFRFLKAFVGEFPVVVLEIGRAFSHPVRFKGHEYIRVGSYKKLLVHFPEKEKELWRTFEQTPFEVRIAVERAKDDEVLRLLDYSKYFELMDRPLPNSRGGILDALEQDRLIHRSDAGSWNVSNLGLALFAKNMDDLGNLVRKSVRVIKYRGTSRIETLRELAETAGYAAGFENLIRFVNFLLPTVEVIEDGIRKAMPMFPELAVREILANALIH